MATSYAPLSLPGVRPRLNTASAEFLTQKSAVRFGTVKLRSPSRNRRNLSVRAEFGDGDRSGGGDFFAGFLLGGAVFGTLAYVFAPQIRRSLLNEDDHGFRKARKPIYYDEGLERTRQTLNEKIGQLNSAIDNVSSRLRGGNSSPPVPIENDPELEATV